MTLTPETILFKDNSDTIVGSIYANSSGMVISSSDLNDTKVEGNLNVTGNINNITLSNVTGEESFAWNDASTFNTSTVDMQSIYASDQDFNRIENINLHKSWLNKCVIGTSGYAAWNNTGDSDGSASYQPSSGIDDFTLWQGAHVLSPWTRIQSSTKSTSYLANFNDSSRQGLVLGNSILLNCTISSTTGDAVTSDDRLKHNEIAITDGLATVNKLKPFFYLKTEKFYDSDHNFGPSDEIPSDAFYESGYIAQDVKEIPELSHLVSGEEFDKFNNPTPMHLNYIGIQPFLCRAIQELATKNSELEAKNTDLETRLATVEAALATFTAASSN